MSIPMTLGSYSFLWNPDKFTLPQVKKYDALVLTYSSAEYFSWGLSIIGKEIVLEWGWMLNAQYQTIYALWALDADQSWEPGNGTTYTVAIRSLDSTLSEVTGYEAIPSRRENVKLTLAILAIVGGGS